MNIPFLEKRAMAKFSRQEELDLLKQYQQTGDVKAFKKLRISVRPLIYRVIGQNKPKNNDVTEAQLYARVDGELPRMFKSYDPTKGELSTYLTNQATFLVQNAVKENVLGPHVPRPEQDALFAYRQGLIQAKVEFGNNPTSEQVLKYTPNIKSVDEIDRIKTYHTESLVGDAKFGDSEDGMVAFKDQFTDGISQDMTMTSLKMEELRRKMHLMNPQEREIINQHVFQNKTIADIALSLGMSSSEVRRIIVEWKKKNGGV